MAKEKQSIVPILMKVITNLQVIGLLVGVFFILFMVNPDYLINPQLEILKKKEADLKKEKQKLDEKNKEQQQFQVLLQQVQELETIITPLKPGESPKIIAAQEEKKIINLARSNPNLPEPHNERQFISIENQGDALLNVLEKEPNSPPLNLWKFDYTLTMEGTYAALSDFLNQITLSENLLEVNNVEFSLTDEESDRMPNAENNPNYPVPLTMTLTFSLYIHESAN